MLVNLVPLVRADLTRNGFYVAHSFDSPVLDNLLEAIGDLFLAEFETDVGVVVL